MPIKTKVVIFGGGIAGLTVALELAIRKDFDITVYEKNAECGGKAKSHLTNEGYPGEHSIRTISRTYYHLRDSLKRIPSNDGTILDHVISPPAGSRKFLLFEKYDTCVLPTYFPYKPSEFAELYRFVKNMNQILRPKEIADFIFKLIKSASISPERRLATLEKQSWDEYLDVENKSENFRNYFGRLPEFYVAAKGDANARSACMLIEKSLFLPLIHPIDSRHSSHDIFDGPTSEVLIKPWVNYLKSLGVVIKTNSEAIGITLENNSIKNVKMKDDELISADVFVFAVPVEVMTKLANANPEIKKAAPSLDNLNKLSTVESSGIQFFVKDSIREKFPKGFTAFLDSPWSLIAIYQDHPNFNLKEPAVGYISVAWSNFDKPGVLHKKSAHECSAIEIKEEILAQMKRHKGTEFIKDLDLVSWSIDPELQFSNETGVMIKHNGPLFVQMPNCYQYQPESYTEIPNLFLAADYVRTSYDLATMESANEAGRRCANAILRYTKSEEKPSFVKENVRTGFGLFQQIDRFIFYLQKYFQSSKG